METKALPNSKQSMMVWIMTNRCMSAIQKLRRFVSFLSIFFLKAVRRHSDCTVLVVVNKPDCAALQNLSRTIAREQKKRYRVRLTLNLPEKSIWQKDHEFCQALSQLVKQINP